tara:strand:+ start:2211 stop:2801 length:591 start_codon:yes stop_codon:yes gene_type:complete
MLAKRFYDDLIDWVIEKYESGHEPSNPVSLPAVAKNLDPQMGHQRVLTGPKLGLAVKNFSRCAYGKFLLHTCNEIGLHERLTCFPLSLEQVLASSINPLSVQRNIASITLDSYAEFNRQNPPLKEHGYLTDRAREADHIALIADKILVQYIEHHVDFVVSFLNHEDRLLSRKRTLNNVTIGCLLLLVAFLLGALLL